MLKFGPRSTTVFFLFNLFLFAIPVWFVLVCYQHNEVNKTTESVGTQQNTSPTAHLDISKQIDVDDF